MITLQDALSWAITEIEGPPVQGKWKVLPLDRGTRVIYGNGLNRYYVTGLGMGHGTVSFSAHHGTQEDADKAAKVGFTLFR